MGARPKQDERAKRTEEKREKLLYAGVWIWN